MLTDDEMLEKVRGRAGVLRSRRRLYRGGTALILAAALIGAAVVTSGADERSSVVSTADDSTTSTAPDRREDIVERTRPAPTTTVPTSPSSTSPAPTSTTEPAPASTDEPVVPIPTFPDTSAPPTTVPPTTEPPLVRFTQTNTVDGLTVRVAVTHSSAPGDRSVWLDIRVQTDRGNDLWGQVIWDSGYVPTTLGSDEQHPDLCNPAAEPDPDAGPIDESFSAGGTLDFANAGPHQIDVLFTSSACFADGAKTPVDIVVTFT